MLKEKKKKRFEEEFDKYSKDIRKVLDNCIRERTIRRELFIAEQQVFESEYSPVLQIIWNKCETDEVIKILTAFNYGMICGKRKERKRQSFTA